MTGWIKVIKTWHAVVNEQSTRVSQFRLDRRNKSSNMFFHEGEKYFHTRKHFVVKPNGLMMDAVKINIHIMHMEHMQRSCGGKVMTDMILIITTIYRNTLHPLFIHTTITHRLNSMSTIIALTNFTSQKHESYTVFFNSNLKTLHGLKVCCSTTIDKMRRETGNIKYS